MKKLSLSYPLFTWTYLGLLWLLLVLIPLWQRHLLPIDETRYLAVAWEMWLRGDWLVPHLNGQVYSHKPPLLFWLINLGWSIFGVNEWWPRLLPGLFSLGNVILTIYLGRLLWPQRPQISQFAALILLSSSLWSLFTGAVMFDLLLTGFVLLGIIALTQAAKSAPQISLTAVSWLGIAIGFGILTKGPIIFLPLLLVGFTAPWWHPLTESTTDLTTFRKLSNLKPKPDLTTFRKLSNLKPKPDLTTFRKLSNLKPKPDLTTFRKLSNLKPKPDLTTFRKLSNLKSGTDLTTFRKLSNLKLLSWYGGIFLSILIGTIIALSWAIPAGLAGGAEYRAAIFWGQTANRLVQSFAHQRSFWWYLPTLPIVLFPWLLWPPVWRGFLQLTSHSKDTWHYGVKLCLVWTGGTFFLLSLISGKQTHYLLPLFPGFALLAAYLLDQLPSDQQYQRWDNLAIGIILILIGLPLLIVTKLPIISYHHSPLLPLLSTQTLPCLVSGAILIFIGGGLIFWSPLTLPRRLFGLSLASVILSLTLLSIVAKSIGPAYNLQPISNYISTLQHQGHTVAHLGEYHGQYQFLGRLQPLPLVDEYNLCAWLVQHPDSKLIIYQKPSETGLLNQAEYVQNYRSNHVAIIPVHTMYAACSGV